MAEEIFWSHLRLLVDTLCCVSRTDHLDGEFVLDHRG